MSQDMEGKHRLTGARGPRRFKLGQVVATPGALAELERIGADPRDLLERHADCDWGELDDHDRQANEDALRDGSRIFSAYTVNGVKFWVITEADRSVTTALLPDEY